MLSAVHFPSEAVIKSYLENQHPLTKNNSSMKEKKVFEVAARTFADQEKSLQDIQKGLFHILHDAGYNPPYPAVLATVVNLSKALTDCATENIV